MNPQRKIIWPGGETEKPVGYQMSTRLKVKPQFDASVRFIVSEMWCCSFCNFLCWTFLKTWALQIMMSCGLLLCSSWIRSDVKPSHSMKNAFLICYISFSVLWIFTFSIYVKCGVGQGSVFGPLYFHCTVCVHVGCMTNNLHGYFRVVFKFGVWKGYLKTWAHIEVCLS